MVYIPIEPPREPYVELCDNPGCENPALRTSHWCKECKDKPKNFPPCECGRPVETFKKNEETGKIDVPCCIPCLHACFPGLMEKDEEPLLKCFQCSENDYFYFAPNMKVLEEAIGETKIFKKSIFLETRKDANIQRYLDDEEWEDELNKDEKKDRLKVVQQIEEIQEDVFVIHKEDIREEMFDD